MCLVSRPLTLIATASLGLVFSGTAIAFEEDHARCLTNEDKLASCDVVMQGEQLELKFDSNKLTGQNQKIPLSSLQQISYYSSVKESYGTEEAKVILAFYFQIQSSDRQLALVELENREATILHARLLEKVGLDKTFHFVKMTSE